MNRAFITKIATVAVPCLFAIVLIVVAVVQRNRFVRDTNERQKVETEITQLLQSMQMQEAMASKKVAAIQEDSKEESDYLTFLRSAAASTGVRITRYTAEGRPLETIQSPASPALAGVMALKGRMEISGSYAAMLNFVRRLEENERLYNLTEVVWNRADQADEVRLAAQITRYVFTATPPATTATTPAPANP